MAVPVKVALIVFACLVLAIGLITAMSTERATGYYECQSCKEVFTPTWASYIRGPHTLTRRWMKCPHCGKRTGCRHLMNKEQ